MSLTITPHVLKLDADSATPLVLTTAPYVIGAMTLKPGAIGRTMIGGLDGDGELPIGAESTENIIMELSVMIDVAAATTMDAALAAGEMITTLLADIARRDEPLAIDYTPPNTTQISRLYAVSGAVVELPTQMTGDGAGWYHGSPVYRLKLVCDPFIYGDEVTETTTSGTRRELQLADVGGDVDAVGSIAFSGTGMRAVWGLESEGFNPASPAATRITDGSGGAVVGPYTIKPQTQPQVIFRTTAADMQGNKRLRVALKGAEVQTGLQCRVRLYVAGAGSPLWTSRWAAMPRIATVDSADIGEWSVFECGSFNVAPSASGAPQSVSVDVEVRKTFADIANASTLGDLRFLWLDIMPAERTGSADASLIIAPARIAPLAFEDFKYSGGPVALNGTTAELGGVWATGGSATDFSTALGVPFGVVRSSGLDATAAATNLPNGRLATLPIANGVAGAGITFNFAPTAAAGGKVSLLFRYVDSTHWSLVSLHAPVASGTGRQFLRVECQSANGSVGSVLQGADVEFSPATFFGVDHALAVFNVGAWSWVYLDGVLVAKLPVYPVIPTAASGNIGFIDQGQGAGVTRIYREFVAWQWNGSAAQIAAPKFESDREGQIVGGLVAPVARSGGSRVFIPPAGSRDKTTRIVTRLENGIDSSVITDVAYTLTVKYRPRYRLPRG